MKKVTQNDRVHCSWSVKEFFGSSESFHRPSSDVSFSYSSDVQPGESLEEATDRVASFVVETVEKHRRKRRKALKKAGII